VDSLYDGEAPLILTSDTYIEYENNRKRLFRRLEDLAHEYPIVFAGDLAPKFYPVLSSLQRFWVAVFGAVAAGCCAEPFRLRSTASRRGLIV
jgi:hypothetical protein